MVEGAFLVDIRAFDRCRVFDAPMRGHRLSRPDGTCFACRAVANREDEIHLRRIRRCELIPVFRAQALGWIAVGFERLERERIDRALRMAPRREGVEAPRSQFAKDAFREDRAGAVAGAEKEDVEDSDQSWTRAFRWAARGEIGDERRAYVRTAAAAILQKEQRDFAKLGEIGAVDDRAAVALPDDQTGAGENGEMRRHGVLRHSHQAGEFARRNAFRFSLDQQPKGVQPRRLGERREGGDGFQIIHISRLSDIYDGRKPTRMKALHCKGFLRFLTPMAVLAKTAIMKRQVFCRVARSRLAYATGAGDAQCRADYTTIDSAVAPSAPRITTNQGGTRQNTRSRKARTPSPKSAGAKIALVQTGV